MQKVSLFTFMIVASLILTGCSLLGGTDDVDTLPVVREPSGSTDSESMQKEAAGTMESETPIDTSGEGAQLLVAQPDPAAEQKAMMEAQDDAPTGVQTR